MAKRKLSRTDTRTGGDGNARKSSRSSSSKRSKPSGRSSDKFFDRNKPSSRVSGDDGGERPKRNYSRGGDSSYGERGARSFDRKRSGGDREQRGGARTSRDYNKDAKPRRSFPDGFKRDDRRADGPKREFRASDPEKRSFGSRTERPFGNRPFERNKPFDKDNRRNFSGDREERPKRNFKRDDDSSSARNEGTSERKRSYGNRSERNEGTSSFPKKKPFQRDEFSEERPKRNFRRDEDDAGVSKRPFRDRTDNTEDSRPFAKKRSTDSDADHSERPARSPRRDDDASEDSARRSDPRSAPFAGREVKNDRGKRPRKSFLESKTQSSKGYSRTDVQNEEPGEIRLNRYLANSGISSRREADEFIKMGLVTVNGKTIVEMGYKVQPGDIVKYEGKMLRAEKPVYLLMNKPKGYLTTTSDPEDRKTVLELIGPSVRERIYPVGRLDRNTTGLLLLTNDGALAEQLSHPSYQVTKIYKVDLDKPLTKADFEKIKQGIYLDEGRAMVDDLAIVSDDGKTVGLEIHIGWNRVVRRIFESLDYQVVKLDRTIYAGLDKKDLPRGKWRHLREEEVVRLKHLKKGI